jgi:hypothetical protein
MSIPAITDPRWQRALTGAEPQVSSLATRLLLKRLRDNVRVSPGQLGKSTAELHQFFLANAFAARDLPAL